MKAYPKNENTIKSDTDEFAPRKGVGPVGECSLPGWKHIPLNCEWIEFCGGCFPLAHIAGTRNDDGTFTPFPGELRLPIYYKSTRDHGRMHMVLNGVDAGKAFAWDRRGLAPVEHVLSGLQEEGWCM